MTKVKLYVIAGAILIVGAGFLMFINSTKRYEGDAAVNQADFEEKNGFVSQIEEGVVLPSEFPQDFPIYPEAKLENSYQSKGEEVNAVSVIWLVPEKLEKVSSFYKRELENTGRRVFATFEDENSVTMSFEKDQEEGFIGIGSEEGNVVVVSVTIGESFKEPSI